MKPRNFARREHITRAQNQSAAVAKASTAPLHTLTSAMLESIAASHARRGSRDHEALVTRLREIVSARRAREAA